MQPPFSFEVVLIFGAMAVFLLVGVVLRAKITFFQRFLIPSCLIGGILGLIALSLGLLPFTADQFEAFAFHLFVISFISVGLTHDGEEEKKKGAQKEFVKGAWWLALMEGVAISLQGLIGCLLVIFFGAIGLKLFPTFGLFLPLGFTEGPGQALSIGKSWEAFGFANAGTIGLTFAVAGFFFAFFVGVPLVNWGIRKGLSTHGPVELPKDLLKGIVSANQPKEKAGELTMHSGNIDTLAFQMALVGLVYVVTYFFVVGFNSILPAKATQANWGFFFFYGMFIAILIRMVMRKAKVMRLIDPGIQRRITGWAVDFLIVATIMAVQVKVVLDNIWPIVVMSLTAGLVTTAAMVYFGKRLDKYNLERTVAIYGTVTGTVSSGLLLLRIADPEFRTPVAFELGFMNIMVIPLIVSSMILVNAPVWWGWGLWLTSAAHVGLLLVSVLLLKISKLWGPKQSLVRGQRRRSINGFPEFPDEELQAMKAVVCQKDRLELARVPRPEPEPDQVLIRVANTGFCGSDHSLIKGGQCPEGLILGHEVSGVVEAWGNQVKDVPLGARVIVRPTYCGACRECLMGKPYLCQNNRRLIGLGDLPGAFAEYIVVYPQMLIYVPEGVDSQNAALAEAYAASLHGIRASRSQGGSALVIGGGPIGLALLQQLKILGFGPITLSEPVKEKRDLALALGADFVIDPLTENLGLHTFQQTGGIGYETVFECSGAPVAVQSSLDAAARGGTVCIVSVMYKPVEFSSLTMTFKEIWMTAAYSNTHEENRQVLDWMAQGRLDGRRLITDLITLDQLPEVYEKRIDTGQSIKVMLEIGEEF